ncbi:MAG: hypothetical protein ACTHJ8_02970 [Mucilaginibacter sp.]
MLFPFTIEFKVKLKESLRAEDYPIVLKYVSDYIEKKSATDIVIKQNTLTFNVVFDRSKFHLLRPIDGGEFKIEDKGDHIILTYKIFIYRAFYVYALLAIGVGVTSGSTVFGILIFLAMYCPNLIAAGVIHSSRLEKIADGINASIQQKSNIHGNDNRTSIVN